MSLPADSDELLNIIREAVPERSETVRLGTVGVVNADGIRATVRFDGESAAGAKEYLSVNYRPVAGDRVALLRAGHSWIIIGKVGSTPSGMDLTRWLHRRAPWKGSGGGAINFDGSTLSGTQRYIWIPSGAGGGSHFNLEDTANTNAAWSITGINAWTIVYATLTDAEWASTGRLSLPPSRWTVQGYTAYTPAENHLVLGWRNGDGQDGRFYLADGRVLDYWRAPTFQNGWANYSGYNSAGYYKDADGFVHLRGLVHLGTASTIFTLPVGYRPAARELMGTISNSAIGRCDVDTGGNVIMQLGSNAWFALDSLTFRAAA